MSLRPVHLRQVTATTGALALSLAVWAAALLVLALALDCAPLPRAVLVSALHSVLLFPCALLLSRLLLRPRPRPTSRFWRAVSPFSAPSLVSACAYSLCSGASFWALSSLWPSRDVVSPCAGRCVDERTVFLFLSGVWTGLASWKSAVGADRDGISSPPIRRLKFVQIKEALFPEFCAACRLAPLYVFCFPFLYRWCHRLILPARLIAAFDPRLPGTLSLLWSPLSARCLFCAVAFLCSQRWIRCLLTVYLSEPYAFGVSPGPESLASGLRDPERSIRQLAARDLFSVSSRAGPRRSELFGLSSPGGHPTNWKDASSACLDVIDRYRREVEEIAGDVVPVAPRPLAVSAAEPVRGFAMRNLAYQSPPRSPTVGEPEKTAFETIADELAALPAALKRRPTIAFVFGELEEAKVKNVICEGRTVTLVCRGLSELCAVSLVEDRYGVVQDTLPSVIRSLLGLKRAFDRLTKSGVVNKKSFRQDLSSVKTLAELKSTVKRSIYRITVSFGKYVDEIPLDDSDSRALQSFIDMRES